MSCTVTVNTWLIAGGDTFVGLRVLREAVMAVTHIGTQTRTVGAAIVTLGHALAGCIQVVAQTAGTRVGRGTVATPAASGAVGNAGAVVISGQVTPATPKLLAPAGHIHI